MFSGHRVTIVVILCLFGICLSQSGYSQKKRKQSAKTDDNRVYLVHSNTLSYDQRKNPDAQILCGNVEFFHQGAKLF